MRIHLIIPMLLAGCAGAVAVAPQAGPESRAERIAAECRMLAAAHAATGARGVAPPDILVGCPGHEGLRDAMPLRAQTAALRLANRAVVPAAALAAGPRGEEVYRRMLTRGVPEAVAQEIAAQPLFRAAAGGRG